MPTLAQMLGTPTLDQVRAKLLGFLLKPTFPITDWSSGGVVRTQFELDASMIHDLVEACAVIVHSSFLGTEDEKGADGDWLTTLAHGWYEVDKVSASAPQQTISLACAAGNGPYNISAGNIQYEATDGSVYNALTGGALSSGGTLTGIDAIAEVPGAARGLIARMKTPLPGVTVTAAAIKLGVTPFYGRDEERDASVYRRCDERWPVIDVVTDDTDRVVKWVKASSTAINRVRMDPDPANPGGVVITVAGPNGPVTPVGGTVVAGPVGVAQQYVYARMPITDFVTVQDSRTLTILGNGNVTIPSSRMTAAKAAADAAWNKYLGTTQIGDQIKLAELVQAVMDAGAINFTNYRLNALPLNVPLASDQVGVPYGGGLSASLIWAGV